MVDVSWFLWEHILSEGCDKQSTIMCYLYRVYSNHYPDSMALTFSKLRIYHVKDVTKDTSILDVTYELQFFESKGIAYV